MLTRWSEQILKSTTVYTTIYTSKTVNENELNSVFSVQCADDKRSWISSKIIHAHTIFHLLLNFWSIFKLTLIARLFIVRPFFTRPFFFLLFTNALGHEFALMLIDFVDFFLFVRHCRRRCLPSILLDVGAHVRCVYTEYSNTNTRQSLARWFDWLVLHKTAHTHTQNEQFSRESNLACADEHDFFLFTLARRYVIGDTHR